MKKNKIAETRISGTVPGDIMISGDAETLGLSDLKPETVKLVAAELLEQEKSKFNTKAVYGPIDPYATPIFDLKSFRNPVQDWDEVVKRQDVVHDRIKDFFKEILSDKVVITEIHDEVVTENVADFAERWGRMLLDAIPEKPAFALGSIPAKSGSCITSESSAEQIIDRSGKTHNAPELKIETNQQWSSDELKDWRKAQPGNTKQERKPYVFREDRESLMTATSNDGINWLDAVNPEIDWQALRDRFLDDSGTCRFWPNPDNVKEFPVKTEIKIRNYTPDNWPADAPPYFSAEGWEFEKAMKARNLKSMLTIEWLEKQQTEKHALVAKRLREILAA